MDQSEEKGVWECGPRVLFVFLCHARVSVHRRDAASEVAASIDSEHP